MEMRLDEPRQNVAAAGVDGCGVRAWKVTADPRDAPVVNGDVAVHDLEAVVHRQDETVANQERHQALRLQRGVSDRLRPPV